MTKFLQPSNMFVGIFQLSFFIALYLGIQADVSGWWWAGSIFGWAFYTVVGNNMGFHRYFSHGHFTCNKFVEYLMVWTGAMLCLGSPIAYVMTHIIHHKYPDTELDPHGPIRGVKSIFIPFQKTVDPTETPIFARKLIQLKSYAWLHKFYVPFVLFNVLILFLIDYKVALFLWWIPAGFSTWGIGWAVWRQHIGLKPNNAPTSNWEPVYEGLHLNHHEWPQAPNMAINKGEIDWSYQISKLFGVKHNYKGQPGHEEN